MVMEGCHFFHSCYTNDFGLAIPGETFYSLKHLIYSFFPLHFQYFFFFDNHVVIIIQVVSVFFTTAQFLSHLVNILVTAMGYSSMNAFVSCSSVCLYV